MSPLSDQNAVVTGTIEFADGGRPAGAFTVTALVEDVSRADAPSTIVGSASFDHAAFTEAEVAEVPFAVTVPSHALTGIRRLNVRAHVRERLRQQPGERQGATPNVARPNVTEGDFVSTQSHPVTFNSISSQRDTSGSGSIRILVLRV